MNGETHQHYARPYRPRALRLANALGRTKRLRPERDRIVAQAQKRARVQSVPNDFVLEPLDVLLEAIDAEARLNPIGSYLVEERLKANLAVFLRANAQPTRHDAPSAPIFIAGLQRTGTTLLQRLLSSHPDLQTLSTWEAMSPVPRLSFVKLDRAKRVLAAAFGQRAVAYMAPDFMAIHPIAYRAPEEDILLLDHCLRSTVAEATLRVPTFGDWLERQSHREAYRFHARLLRILESARGSAARWVLKSPHHLEWLDDLLAVYPDATIVRTHRDPTQTMASFCSMIAHSRGVFSDNVDPHEIGKQWLRKVRRMNERSAATRAREQDRFIDIDYERLVSSPFQITLELFAQVGMRVDSNVKRTLRRAVSQNRASNRTHRYSLEAFGLTADQVARELSLPRNSG